MDFPAEYASQFIAAMAEVGLHPPLPLQLVKVQRFAVRTKYLTGYYRIYRCGILWICDAGDYETEKKVYRTYPGSP